MVEKKTCRAGSLAARRSCGRGKLCRLQESRESRLRLGPIAHEGRPADAGWQAWGGVSIDAAYEAAQQCALNVLAQLKLALANDWTRFVQVVRLGGFVNCVPEFNDAPKVVNGASDLMIKVFGSAGAHAREAVGVASLAAGVPVEIEAVFEIS
jgi:enamine deaminase RidA (YjgF/YER057c/UK114 family)